MKQFYCWRWPGTVRKSLLLVVVLVGTISVTNAQTYWASLSGPAEAPPNISPGTGRALVTIDPVANTMRVQATFSGLLAGVTASHIHAATAVPFTGTAGVATSVPTFTGFPSGVTSGTYDRLFDMTLASSFNPSYVTANGGTTASAWTALRTAIGAGRAYLNIHSTMFPGGEIRGFLNLCNVTVAIPDAFALPSGTLANTVYPAYAPASSLTLQANVSGGTSPYNINWSNGGTSSSITVSPTSMTNYSVSVQDQNGCSASASKTVNVVNIAGGKNGDKIVICHHGNTLTIGSPGVADHLSHGDMLGGCVSSVRSVVPDKTDLIIKVLMNPSPNHFDIQLQGKADNGIRITVYDLSGRIVETKTSVQSNQTIRIGSQYQPGMYLIEIVQGQERQTVRLVKTN